MLRFTFLTSSQLPVASNASILRPVISFSRISCLSCLLLLPLLAVSCGTSRPKGLPRNLPTINLQGSAQTPAHSMERKDYPFDPATGNYMVAWASEGEKAASEADALRWASSHGGSVSRKQPSRVMKVSSKKSSSSKGGKSYTIKSGDTLGAIARRNNTTVAKIKAANGMSSDFIRAGKTLKIP